MDVGNRQEAARRQSLRSGLFTHAPGRDRDRLDGIRSAAGDAYLSRPDGGHHAVVVLPFLVLMNEEQYVGRHTSGVFGNSLLATLTILGALMAIVVIPLEIWGS